MYTPQEMIGDTELALDSAVKILDFLEDFYGVKYPFNKSGAVSSALNIRTMNDFVLSFRCTIMFRSFFVFKCKIRLKR